jgi:hypothetical protein
MAISYNYGQMQTCIEESNRAVQNMRQACEDIDAGHNKLADIHSGETRDAVLAKNHQASQRRYDLLAQFIAANEQVIRKMEETQHLDRQGANALLG